MSKPEFVYTIYIKTTPQALWNALIDPEITPQWWFGCVQQCDWRKGAEWRLVRDDGRVVDSGEVIEIDPPRHLVLSWRHELVWRFRSPHHSRCEFAMRTSEPKPHEINKLLVSFDSEVRKMRMPQNNANFGIETLGEELRAEGYSRATFDLEQVDDAVRLTITHSSDTAGSQLIAGVSKGWPQILSSLKSLLETGTSFEQTRCWPVAA